jgi:PKD repeat protein
VTTGANDRWLWDFGDGANSTLRNPTHTYAAIGSYTVRLTSGNGVCENTITITIDVTKNANSITELNVLDVLTVYPNPANEFINIDISKVNTSAFHLSMTNTLGESVIDQSVKHVDNSKPYLLSLKTLSAGVYYLKIESDNHQQFVQKVIVEKQ